MKKGGILFLVFMFQCTALVAQDDSVLEYAHLFPNCIDNQESTIYGGTFSEYPPEIEDAIFPGGGFVKMSQYIYTNTEMQPVYTGELNESGDSLLVTGIVKVEFVVDRCGKVGRVRVVESVSELQDAEALRIIEGFPIFKPASLKDYRVKIAYIAPVYFSKKVMPRKAPEIDYDSYYYW